jgi:hypothetical protein
MVASMYMDKVFVNHTQFRLRLYVEGLSVFCE